jgi:prepilin-type N-terminal cleavage/methylation domain-containing protein
MARPKGFTLLELMIVVVLILVIAAIAIPSMREAQIHANEASAVGSIRAINQVEVQYQATYGGGCRAASRPPALIIKLTAERAIYSN